MSSDPKAPNKSLKVALLAIFLLSLWGSAVFFYLYYYVFKMHEAPTCIFPTIDQVSTLDETTVNSNKYYLVHRLSDSNEKADTIELYNQAVIFDRCAQSNIKPIYTEAVEQNISRDSIQLCTFGVKLDNNKFEVIYTEDVKKCKPIKWLKIIE